MSVGQGRSSAGRGRLSGVYDAHGEKLRYLVVGVCNTAFSYIMFLVLLVALGPGLRSLDGTSGGLFAQVSHNWYLVVQWVGWVLMVPISTTTMKYLAFRSKGRLLHQLGRAYLVYLPAQGLSSLILWLAVDISGLSPQVGQLVSIAIVTVFTYLGHKYFTFRVPLETAEFGEVAEQD